jgi:hypothetical protein
MVWAALNREPGSGAISVPRTAYCSSYFALMESNISCAMRS